MDKVHHTRILDTHVCSLHLEGWAHSPFISDCVRAPHVVQVIFEIEGVAIAWRIRQLDPRGTLPCFPEGEEKRRLHPGSYCP